MQYDAPTQTRMRGFVAALELGDDMRVGKMCPGHAGKIDQPGGDRMARRCHIGDAGGVEYWQIDNLFDGRGQRDKGHQWRARRRDRFRKSILGGERRVRDVHEVEQAAAGKSLGDVGAFLPAEPADLGLVADHPDTDQDV